MSDPFIGEIRMVSFNFAQKGWALCNGQVLPINSFQALFSLLGTTYGGNGTSNFALPNLQGRAPMHVGNGFAQGGSAGESAHTLVSAEMPSHSHLVNGRPTASTSSPDNALWAGSSEVAFTGSPNTTMAAAAITAAGSGQPHQNMPPYLVLNFVIALVGIFPSRN